MTLSHQALIEMYRRMLRIRYFDDAVRAELEHATIPGAVHSSTGQEAAVVGACMALRATDFLTGTHRSHGHQIAKGADLVAMRIREIAREHDIPIIENPPVARLLHKLELNALIPENLFKAVAEILAHVYSLKNQ